MRVAFAHEAVLAMAADGDDRAPGAAVTLALCGHWDHSPPCPLAPHHSQAVRADDDLRIRILFATEPEHEEHARQLIVRALAEGELSGPDGRMSHWLLLTAEASSVTDAEAEHAARLVSSP